MLKVFFREMNPSLLEGIDHEFIFQMNEMNVSTTHTSYYQQQQLQRHSSKDTKQIIDEHAINYTNLNN